MQATSSCRPRTGAVSPVALLLLALISGACGSDDQAASATPDLAQTESASSPAEPPAPANGTPTPAPAVAHAEVASQLRHGLDVSMHSGEVEWQIVEQAGHSFAFIKATEGVDLKDSAFADNWAAMASSGMVRGAYHFYVTEDDPAEQSQFFIDTVDLEPGDLAPVVDIELLGHGTQPGLAQRLRIYLERVEAHYGVKPIIYTAAKFWDEHLDDDFGDYPLWVAHYGVPEPTLPKGWDAWHLWQWQGDATVAGVEKGADLSHVNRDGPDLSELIIPHHRSTGSD